MAEYDKAIAPGGSGKLVAEINTKRVRGGKVAKSIRVTSNSIENKSVSLSCGGLVQVLFDIRPSDRLNFGRVRRGEEKENRLTIQSKDGDRYQVERVESRVQHLTAELAPGEDGTGQVLTATLDATAPIQRLGGSIKLHTNHPKRPVIEVYVSGEVVGPVVLMPRTPRFRRNAAGEKVHLSLRSSGDNTFKILGVEAPEQCEIETRESKPGKQFHVIATLKEPLPSSRGTITVKTDDPEQPTIRVTVTVAPAPRRNVQGRSAPPVRGAQPAAGTIQQQQ